ncbi:MAG: DUF4142 domain-containing protein [Acidisphaera sp.]|nr:DUF4142 domain-containing protein [Acidisphaera sp.]
MSRTATWGLALALLPLAACSGNNPPPMASAPPAPPPPQLSAQDTSFINQAAAGGMAEVQDGQLAASKAPVAGVRQFGSDMVSQHTQVNQQLMTLAQSKGVTPSTDLDPSDAAMLHRLQGLRGRSFDTEYLRGQIAGHEKMAQLLQQEISQGSDPDLKAFAQQTLPTVQEHLARAQKLAGVRPRAPQHQAKS